MPEKPKNEPNLEALLAEYGVDAATEAKTASSEDAAAVPKTARAQSQQRPPQRGQAQERQQWEPEREDAAPSAQQPSERQPMKQQEMPVRRTRVYRPVQNPQEPQNRQGRPQNPYRRGEERRADAPVAMPKRRQEKPQFRHRKLHAPNPAFVLFMLLALAVSGISIGKIVANREAYMAKPAPDQTELQTTNDRENGAETPAQTTDVPNAGGDTETPGDGEDTVLWSTETVSNETLDEGDLILVNYEHAYARADTVATEDVYSGKNDCYQVSSTSIRLTKTALDAMNAMASAFASDTGCKEWIIVSGYRDTAYQQSIYDDRVANYGAEYAAQYVANPGESEHHTGLAMDLSFYTKEGKSVGIAEHEQGGWLNEHCAAYGFVVRYPANKADITKIAYESWHYRYVGIPHAAIMTEKDFCLEEYIAYLRAYTPDTKMLWLQKNGVLSEVSPSALPGEGTLIYFVPAQEGDTTEIRLPRGKMFENTRISGNNADGFIVTVEIG